MHPSQSSREGTPFNAFTSLLILRVCHLFKRKKRGGGVITPEPCLLDFECRQVVPVPWPWTFYRDPWRAPWGESYFLPLRDSNTLNGSHHLGFVSSCHGDGKTSQPTKELSKQPHPLSGQGSPPPPIVRTLPWFLSLGMLLLVTLSSAWILDLSSLFPPDLQPLLHRSLEISSVCSASPAFPVLCGCVLSLLFAESPDPASPFLECSFSPSFQNKVSRSIPSSCSSLPLTTHYSSPRYRGLCSHDSTDTGYHFRWAISLHLTCFPLLCLLTGLPW